MAFCSGCGAALSDGATVCDQCGKEISARISALQMASSKYGSINLAFDLAVKYAKLAKLKDEINDTEFNLKKIEINPNPPRYSFFRFYWPFFIIALIACFIVTLIFAFIVLAFMIFIVLSSSISKSILLFRHPTIISLFLFCGTP